jgi:hypothetical protein
MDYSLLSSLLMDQSMDQWISRLAGRQNNRNPPSSTSKPQP